MVNRRIILEQQVIHGIANVTIGAVWNAQQMRPADSPGQFGVYVRDIPSLILELHKELDDWHLTSPKKSV